MDSLQQFKELVARLNPMRPVSEPNEHAWYVERPDSLARRIARSFDLEPAASHLIIGSIGCDTMAASCFEPTRRRAANVCGPVKPARR